MGESQKPLTGSRKDAILRLQRNVVVQEIPKDQRRKAGRKACFFALERRTDVR